MFLLKEKLGKLSAPDQGEFNLINILTPEGYEGIYQMNLNIEFIQKWFCCKAQEIEKSVFRQELFHQRRLNESSYIALENLSMNDWFAIDCRSYKHKNLFECEARITFELNIEGQVKFKINDSPIPIHTGICRRLPR